MYKSCIKKNCDRMKKKIMKSSFCLKQIAFFGSFDELKMHQLR